MRISDWSSDVCSSDLPPEGALTLRGVLGTREQLGNIVLRRNNFHARDRVLTAQVALAHTERNAYDARTFSLSGTLERQSTIFYQKAWTWSVGAELVATDERDVILSTGAPRRRTYFLGALPGPLGYGGTHDRLNPTRRFRVSGGSEERGSGKEWVSTGRAQV